MIAVEAAPLREIVAQIFAAAGCSKDEAATVAQRLVNSNLAGHDSHGVVRVPSYMELIRTGAVALGRHAEVVHDAGPIAVLDGQCGFGQVIGADAMRVGIDKATKHGVGVVALRRSGHLGRIGDWAELCAEAGLASIHFVNVLGHPGLVAPFGGADGRLGTNPFCAGMPRAGGRHVILDFATSKLAEGKVKVAFNKGAELPEGALLDNKGRPTRDPRDLYTDPRGALRPMGDHKGYGLAVFCEILAGTISGGGCLHPGRPEKGTVLNNMLSIVLNPTPGGDRAAAMAEIEHLIDALKASPPMDPAQKVMIPGDPERNSRVARLRDGIPLDDTTWGNILKEAGKLGLEAAGLRRRAGVD